MHLIGIQNTQNSPNYCQSFGNTRYANVQFREAIKDVIDIFRRYAPRKLDGIKVDCFVKDSKFSIEADNAYLTLRRRHKMPLYDFQFNSITNNEEETILFTTDLKGNLLYDGKKPASITQGKFDEFGRISEQNRWEFITKVSNMIYKIKDNWKYTAP